MSRDRGGTGHHVRWPSVLLDRFHELVTPRYIINVNLSLFHDAKDGLGHYDIERDEETVERRIRNVKRAKLQEVVDRMPDAPIEDQFAFWYKNITSLHLFPDGNNRTAYGIFQSVLFSIGLRISTTTEGAAHLTMEVKKLRKYRKVCMLEEKDELYIYLREWVKNRIIQK